MIKQLYRQIQTVWSGYKEDLSLHCSIDVQHLDKRTAFKNRRCLYFVLFPYFSLYKKGDQRPDDVIQFLYLEMFRYSDVCTVYSLPLLPSTRQQHFSKCNTFNHTRQSCGVFFPLTYI